MDQAQDKKYTFKVAVDANKTQVKLAVEEIFGVEVKKVNIMNIDGKIKRMGRTMGRDVYKRQGTYRFRRSSKKLQQTRRNMLNCGSNWQ